MNLGNRPLKHSNTPQPGALNALNGGANKYLNRTQTIANTTKVAEEKAEKDKQQAKKVLRNGRAVIKGIMNNVAKGKLIDKKAASDVVDACVQELLLETEALSWLIKMRNADDYTSEHSLNVSILAIAFGHYLSMTSQQLKELGLAGLLHDVGKMYIPDQILNKPGMLTDKEREIMQEHTLHGRNVLLDSDVEAYIIDVAYAHHEKMDGTGYPLQKKREELSEYARIISLVDFYDALTAERCYKKAVPHSKVLDIIEENAGKHFDFTLAEKFIKFMGLYSIGTIVELRNGTVGIVAQKNESCHYLPEIYVCQQAHQNGKEPSFIDLSRFDQMTLIEQGYLIKTDHPDGYSGIFLENYIDIVEENS